MYIIQYVNCGAALSAMYTLLLGRISELRNNADFILSLGTWFRHPLISSANGHYRVFGLHNAEHVRLMISACAGLSRAGWWSMTLWRQCPLVRHVLNWKMAKVWLLIRACASQSKLDLIPRLDLVLTLERQFDNKIMFFLKLLASSHGSYGVSYGVWSSLM